MTSILFRGAELRAWTGKIEESGPVHRIKFLADLSRPVAQALGCEEQLYESENPQDNTLRETHNDIKVSGKLRVDRIKVTPNGMKQHAFEMVAQDLEWEIYTKQGKEEDDPKEARVSMAIITGDSFNLVENYARIVGTVAAQVRCVLPDGKQLKLHADEPEEEEAAAAEEADEGPALASVVEMHGNPKKKRSTAPLQ